LVKRVVALPGDAVPNDVIALRDGDAGRVPPGVFVALGDNAARIYDSRRAGYFRTDALLGVVARKLR
jgi:signal peptidase I